MNPLPLVAVAGNPNAGKSALFNALTGARQKVGNYPGVTVERHVGKASLPDGSPIELVDLPGAYGLDPSSPDEAVTRDVLLGKQKGERMKTGTGGSAGAAYLASTLSKRAFPELWALRTEL